MVTHTVKNQASLQKTCHFANNLNILVNTGIPFHSQEAAHVRSADGFVCCAEMFVDVRWLAQITLWPPCSTLLLPFLLDRTVWILKPQPQKRSLFTLDSLVNSF